MLRQRLADPDILAVVSANEKDEVVARGVVGVEEVGDYAEETEAAGEEDELIFFA